MLLAALLCHPNTHLGLQMNPRKQIQSLPKKENWTFDDSFDDLGCSLPEGGFSKQVAKTSLLLMLLMLLMFSQYLANIDYL